MQTKIVRGQAVTPHIADLARLRTTVFRAFPYLYEGSEDYEASYLATYAQSPESLFVLALDGDTGVFSRVEADGVLPVAMAAARRLAADNQCCAHLAAAE